MVYSLGGNLTKAQGFYQKGKKIAQNFWKFAKKQYSNDAL
jgi:hypothetical protein